MSSELTASSGKPTERMLTTFDCTFRVSISRSNPIKQHVISEDKLEEDVAAAEEEDAAAEEEDFTVEKEDDFVAVAEEEDAEDEATT
ncbi:hypothetical protein ACOSQ4_017286 [Xanthoceras sorbifolium]